MIHTILILCLIFFCIVLLIRQHRLSKRQQQLYEQIQAFLTHPCAPNYSLHDDDFALLENAAADLEHRILQEVQNTACQSKQNADFVADISHQLKTPLAGLKLYCEMDAGISGTHAQKQLALIEHMEQLIYSLLRLENLKADAYAMQFETHSLSRLIQAVWNDLRPLYPDKQFVLSGQAQLRCDAKWMQEALLNIIKNACEHTANNGHIAVSLEQSEKSVEIDISDNGGGVPSDELPKLFQRFFHASRNTQKNSAGIGLSITKEIIGKHHGTIFAENTLDGLCIRICIPILDGIQPYENAR